VDGSAKIADQVRVVRRAFLEEGGNRLLHRATLHAHAPLTPDELTERALFHAIGILDPQGGVGRIRVMAPQGRGALVAPKDRAATRA
jgi:hypothetical protein